MQEIVSFLKGRGASVLQLPERVELVTELPLTKVGKVDKKALREDIKNMVDGRLTCPEPFGGGYYEISKIILAAQCWGLYLS